MKGGPGASELIHQPPRYIAHFGRSPPPAASEFSLSAAEKWGTDSCGINRSGYDAPLHQQYISFSGEPHPFPTLELSTGNRVMRRRNTGKEAQKRGVHGTRDQEQGTSN
jgi:hypothetical protein